ncbi:MAG TPA: hypothetical protein VGL86_29890 [Polyangia bacterium]|jgi:hypothetical protein
MGRFVLGAAGALLIGLAVWAAVPSTPPLASSAASSAAVAPASAPSAERGSDPHPGPRRPTPADAPSLVPPTLVQPGPGDLDVKIAACIGAERGVAAARAQRGRPAPPGQPTDAAVVARGCASLYLEPTCRDAMIHFDTPPPELRSAKVLQACARAYCDKLPQPKPQVCGHVDAVPQDEAQYSEWSDLRRAILTHDIGASATQIVLAAPPRAR